MNVVAKRSSKPTPAQIRRRKKALRAHDERIVKNRIADHERLALAIVEAVKLDPYIQWEIVSDWLERHGYVLASKVEADSRLADLLKNMPCIRGKSK